MSRELFSEFPAAMMENMDYSVLLFQQTDDQLFEIHLTDLQRTPREPDFPPGHGQSLQVLITADPYLTGRVVGEIRAARDPYTAAWARANDWNCEEPGKPIYLDRLAPEV